MYRLSDQNDHDSPAISNARSLPLQFEVRRLIHTAKTHSNYSKAILSLNNTDF